MLPPITFFGSPKSILRAKMKAERKAAAKARPDAGVHAARNFMVSIELPENAVISVYYPMRQELDTEPLVSALIEHGCRIALPVTPGNNQPLVFRAYAPGDALVDGAYGEMIPTADAATLTPQIVVAPLLAFDRTGGRLGYGGGYYDRTLEQLRREGAVTAVGYAFGAQEVDAVPLSPVDQPLDWVVTERGAIRC